MKTLDKILDIICYIIHRILVFVSGKFARFIIPILENMKNEKN
jgi:hypothetical protein